MPLTYLEHRLDLLPSHARRQHLLHYRILALLALLHALRGLNGSHIGWSWLRYVEM